MEVLLAHGPQRGLELVLINPIPRSASPASPEGLQKLSRFLLRSSQVVVMDSPGLFEGSRISEGQEVRMHQQRGRNALGDI